MLSGIGTSSLYCDEELRDSTFPFECLGTSNRTIAVKWHGHWKKRFELFERARVKSGIFGQTAKFGQPLCSFHSSIVGIKNKLTKQTVKILMRRLIRSRLIWISTVCKRVSEFT